MLFARCLNWLNRTKEIAAPASPATHSHNCTHTKFKTKPGSGPFLPSYDGRVIPLRKAHFLRHR